MADAQSVSSSEQAALFSPFSLLPTELRDRVWSLYLDSTSSTSTLPTLLVPLRAGYWRTDSLPPLPRSPHSLLSVNRESRYFYLSKCARGFSVSHSFWNPLVGSKEADWSELWYHSTRKYGHRGYDDDRIKEAREIFSLSHDFYWRPGCEGVVLMKGYDYHNPPSSKSVGKNATSEKSEGKALERGKEDRDDSELLACGEKYTYSSVTLDHRMRWAIMPEQLFCSLHSTGGVIMPGLEVVFVLANRDDERDRGMRMGLSAIKSGKLDDKEKEDLLQRTMSLHRSARGKLYTKNPFRLGEATEKKLVIRFAQDEEEARGEIATLCGV